MYSGLTDSIWRGAGCKEVVLYLNHTALTTELLSLTISGSVNADQEQLIIGSTCARTVKIQFAGVQNSLTDGLLELEMHAGNEVLPLGQFQVTESVTRGGQTTVTAADAMLCQLEQSYVSGTNQRTVWAVLSDVSSKSGVPLGTSITDMSSNLTYLPMGNPSGKSYRTVVGWAAALCGRNAVIGRTGALEFVWYRASGFSLSQQECYDGMDQVQESDSVFSNLEVLVTGLEGGPKTLTPANASGCGGMIENPYMTQGWLDILWAEIGGLTYRPAELSFLGDLRLDAGDLITYTLADGTSVNVAVMNLVHTFDGGVMTQITAAGQSEVAAELSGGGALTGQVKKLTANMAQFEGLTITDVDGTTQINGARIDTKTLFAQDITATGKISGLTLAGEFIDINAEDADYASTAYVKTAQNEETHAYSLTLRTKTGNSLGELVVSPSGVEITGAALTINVDQVSMECQNDTYTSFDGGVVSSGSVTVIKKGGWCLVHGSITLSSVVSSMTNILSSTNVPPPQHGVGVYTTAAYWASSFVRNMRIGIGAGGSLRIQYGGSGTYPFAIVYPID